MDYQRTKRFMRASAFIFGALSFVPATLDASDAVKDKIAEIVQAEAGFELFSGTVVVADHGQIIYAKAVGEANKENHIPNTLKTRFNISSVQKTFIATVIMQLVQTGEIKLTDPLIKYFPDCPYPTADRIQIQHLLNHSSGLADYRDNDEYQARAEEFKNIDEVLPFVYKIKPAFDPGEDMEYSNAGVLYLKAIIERVTGKSLKENLTERIFVPLGMDDTVLFVGGDSLANRATGYERAPDGEGFVRVTGEPSAYAGGGIYTNGRDLLLFDQALYGEELLDAKHKEIMFTPVGPQPVVAFGWFVVPWGGTTVVMHSGGSGGFSTEFRRYPEKGYTIIVDSNYGGGAGFEMTNAIEALLLGLPYEVTTEMVLWHRKGMALQRAENYQEALEYFGKCIEGTDPYLPSLYQAARTRILDESEQARAIELLDRYIELAGSKAEPSVAAAWWRKGIAYEQLEDSSGAIASYRKSLELDPEFKNSKEALKRLGAEQ
jgi:CubicO group peptidase (beta-lactamase class C family)